MKKIILLALAALMMVGCEYKTDAEIEEAKRLDGFNIVVSERIMRQADIDQFGPLSKYIRPYLAF